MFQPGWLVVTGSFQAGSSTGQAVEARDYLQSLKMFGSRPGLKRIEMLCESAGLADDLPLIQVGGTNGKGSTTALLSTIYKEAGYRVGRYISPHILGFNERISINGKWITDQELEEMVNQLRPHAEKVAKEGEHPTFFEFLTALAYLYFINEEVDLAVFEVGMGGRLDATSLFPSLLSVVTNVELEHTSVLGETREEIAAEIGGIVRDGGILVTGCAEPGLSVLESICRRRRAELHYSGELCAELLGKDWSGQCFSLATPQNHYHDLYCPLLGRFQLANITLAVRAVELLFDRFPVEKKEIRDGLRKVTWPGRMEVLSQSPRILLDGAHNPAGAKSLREGLFDLDYNRLVLLLAIFRDKDVEGILDELLWGADRLYLTENSDPRSLDVDCLYELSSARFSGPIQCFDQLPRALEAARDGLEAADLLVVAGSLSTVADARPLLMGFSG